MHNLNTKVRIGIISITLITFSIYYFYPKDEYVMEMVKPANSVIEKIEKIEDTPKKENIVIPTIEKRDRIVEKKQIIEREKVLFTTTDSSDKYIIQLLNNVEIEIKNKDISRNINILGEIEDNSIKTNFSISINEDYINYLSDLKIRIIDNTNKERIIETASYFLGALDLDNFYEIKLKIRGDTLEGEVIRSDKISNTILKDINEKINNEQDLNKKEN